MTIKAPCQGRQGIGKYCQNTGTTPGVLYGQVVNFLILNIKDIGIFAAKFSNFSLELNVSAKSHLPNLAQRKVVVRQEKHREFEQII